MGRNFDSVPCYFVRSVTCKGCILLPPCPAYLRDVVASCGPLRQRPAAIEYRESPCAGASGASRSQVTESIPSSTAFTPCTPK
jgi:hypothetical protein